MFTPIAVKHGYRDANQAMENNNTRLIDANTDKN